MLKPEKIASSFDGFKLKYWVQHAGAADRCLLLIHGGASNHTRWSEFVEYTSLAHSWNIVCPDMRGNGESMTRGRQDMPVWCSDLIDILDAEQAGQTVIVGHSLGAQIAINAVHRNPGRFRGLALIDPVFQSSLRGRSRVIRRYRWLVRGMIGVIAVLNKLGLRRRQIEDRDLRELDEETRQAIAGDESFEAIAKRYGALRPILRHMPTGNYLRQALATVGPLPPLESIDRPVLVLLSGGTTLANIDVNRRELARFPHSEIVTLDANHWPLTETPDDVRDAIDTWVSHLPGQ